MSSDTLIRLAIQAQQHDSDLDMALWSLFHFVEHLTEHRQSLKPAKPEFKARDCVVVGPHSPNDRYTTIMLLENPGECSATDALYPDGLTKSQGWVRSDRDINREPPRPATPTETTAFLKELASSLGLRVGVEVEYKGVVVTIGRINGEIRFKEKRHKGLVAVLPQLWPTMKVVKEPKPRFAVGEWVKHKYDDSDKGKITGRNKDNKWCVAWTENDEMCHQEKYLTPCDPPESVKESEAPLRDRLLRGALGNVEDRDHKILADAIDDLRNEMRSK